jgi:hypothetical protein
VRFGERRAYEARAFSATAITLFQTTAAQGGFTGDETATLTPATNAELAIDLLIQFLHRVVRGVLFLRDIPRAKTSRSAGFD